MCFVFGECVFLLVREYWSRRGRNGLGNGRMDRGREKWNEERKNGVKWGYVWDRKERTKWS